jgi:hypothetical protein
MHPFLLSDAYKVASPAKPRTVDVDERRAKRELRLHIARLRRRIDRRIWGLERERRRLTSWRTYVQRYPAQALAAAVGLGLAASAGLSRGWPRLLGVQLTRRALDRAIAKAWHELEAIWAESKPHRPAADPSGAQNGRS